MNLVMNFQKKEKNVFCSTMILMGAQSSLFTSLKHNPKSSSLLGLKNFGPISVSYILGNVDHKIMIFFLGTRRCQGSHVLEENCSVSFKSLFHSTVIHLESLLFSVFE